MREADRNGKKYDWVRASREAIREFQSNGRIKGSQSSLFGDGFPDGASVCLFRGEIKEKHRGTGEAWTDRMCGHDRRQQSNERKIGHQLGFGR